MLKELSYYFTAAQACEEWEKLEDKYGFIKKCYLFAQKFQVSEFWKQFYNVKTASELEEVRNRVAIAMAELDSSYLSRNPAIYTPITDIKEQLKSIYDKAVANLQDWDMSKKAL